MLIVTSLQASPKPLVREAAWFHFVSNRGSTHSTAAVTLPYIMNRCEQRSCRTNSPLCRELGIVFVS
jgi:hypothetical protein